MKLLGDKIAVIGLGYVGLPLAALCARKGYAVTGFDRSENVIASLREGRCHFRCRPGVAGRTLPGAGQSR